MLLLAFILPAAALANAPEKIPSAFGLRSIDSPTDTERPGWKRDVCRELGMAVAEFLNRKELLLLSERAKEAPPPPWEDDSELEERERWRELEAFEGGGSCRLAAAAFVRAVVVGGAVVLRRATGVVSRTKMHRRAALAYPFLTCVS